MNVNDCTFGKKCQLANLLYSERRMVFKSIQASPYFFGNFSVFVIIDLYSDRTVCTCDLENLW